jgi:phasin family protein
MSDEEFTMIVNLFSKALETPQALPEPLIKANKLFIDNMESILAFQMHALKSYMGISINQIRAAAEITDLNSLQDFYQRQAEIAQTVQRKLMNDARIMSGMAVRLKTEMDALTETTWQESLLKAA